MKQGEFADLVGISSTALSQIETNNTVPKKSTLNRICEHLGITVELLYLLSITADSIPEKNRNNYANMFPQVRKLMIDIFSEDNDTLIVD